MQVEITPEDWIDICSEAHKVTSSNTLREFKWKVITRYFCTPQIVAKLLTGSSNRQRRECGDLLGNLTHLFWSCPKIQPFWEDICKVFGDIFYTDIPFDPTVAILGVIPEGVRERRLSYLLQILFFAAIKCITSKCYISDTPTYEQWI